MSPKFTGRYPARPRVRVWRIFLFITAPSVLQYERVTLGRSHHHEHSHYHAV